MNNPEKKRYSDAELQEFKELIDKKLEISRGDLAHLQEQLLEINEEADAIKAGNFDEGSQNYEREHIAKMIQRAQEFVRNLEFALIRIKNKTYGVCTITGDLIDKKRLMMVPHTTKSIEGKDIEKKTPPPVVAKPEVPKTLPVRPAGTLPADGKKIISKPLTKKTTNTGTPDNWDDEDSLNGFDLDDDNMDDLDLDLDLSAEPVDNEE